MPKNNSKFATSKRSTLIEPRINDEITGIQEVRLIYRQSDTQETEGDFVKVMSWRDAVAQSKHYQLDLIEVNNRAVPPIVLLADYSKYLWNLKKKAKEKSKQKSLPLKEVQLSTHISEHDIEVKAKRAAEFVADGHKVKVVLTIRGRELGRREESKKSFYQFLEKLSDIQPIVFDNPPRDEGNKVIAIVRCKK